MLTDWRGNEIKVGSKIVYPGRQGSIVWMNEAVVLEVLVEQEETTLRVERPAGEDWSGNPIPPKRVTLTALGNVTVIG